MENFKIKNKNCFEAGGDDKLAFFMGPIMFPSIETA
jgi:hypothetical protein